jgi:hypothetical protein
MRPARRIPAPILAACSLFLATSLLALVFFVLPATEDVNDGGFIAPEKQPVSQEFGVLHALAAPLSQTTSVPTQNAMEAQATPEVNESIGDDTCLQCHGQPNISMPLENGELLVRLTGRL